MSITPSSSALPEGTAPAAGAAPPVGNAGGPVRLVAVSATGLFSGAERVLVDALEAANGRGWRVRCLSPRGPLRDALTDLGVDVVEIPELKLGDGPLAAAAMAARWAVAARRLRAEARHADVVLVNGAHALPALRAARVAVAACWLVHDVVVRRDLRLMVRAGAPAVDLAIGVSDAAAAFPRQMGIETTVVRNGTRWPVEAARGSGAGEPRLVGLSGALTSWKGHHVLLEAAARLPHDVVIELMGGHFPKDEPYVAQLRARAAQPDLAGRVLFLGRLEDPLARMRTWDVAVSASVDPEAAPLAVLEAMSVGLPLVATAHGGTVEVVGDAAELVPPGDAEAMAAAIMRLLDDPGLAARRGRAGRSLVEAHYQLPAALDRLLDVVESRRSRRDAPTMSPAVSSGSGPSR